MDNEPKKLTSKEMSNIQYFFKHHNSTKKAIELHLQALQNIENFVNNITSSVEDGDTIRLWQEKNINA
jgi:hypothetical protein